MYLYETHCHSSQCSACGHSTSRELVRAYHAAGYKGLVLTDHFVLGNTSVDRSRPWEEQMKAYYGAFLEAKEEGDKLDFDVIFAIEHAYGAGKEVLLYGIDLPFLLENPDIPRISLRELARRVREQGGVVIMAHPYRDRDYVDMSVQPQEEVLDGIELYNACDAPGEDLQALALAERNPRYILTSGGDIHHRDDPRIGAAGLWFDRRIRNSRELAAALKERKHCFQVAHEKLSQIRAEHLGG